MPATAAEALWARLAELRQRYPDVRWSPHTKLHLTLVFLGATDAASIPEISARISATAGEHAQFEIVTGEGGGYLDGRGGVAWLEIGAGREPAARLALALDAALGSRAYARRPPRPHLTLARRVTPALLEDVHRLDRELQTRFLVQHAVLFRSHTGPGSADYEELGRWALGAGAANSSNDT